MEVHGIRPEISVAASLHRDVVVVGGRAAALRPEGGVLFAATFDHEDVITAGEDGVSRSRAGQRGKKLLSGFVGTLSWIDDRTLLADGSVIRMDTGGSHLLAHHAIQLSAAVDRTHVITGGWDRTVRVWDLEREARPIIVLDAEAASDELVVGAGGRRAVSRSTAAARIELWDVAPSPVQTLAIQDHIEKLLAYQDRLGRAGSWWVGARSSAARPGLRRGTDPSPVPLHERCQECPLDKNRFQVNGVS